MFLSLEGCFFAFALFAIIAMAVSWLSFSRLAMARIERQMREDGCPNPVPWDTIGVRAVLYAYTIVIPLGTFNTVKSPFIDVPAVRRYANDLDRKLGLALLFSLVLMVIVVVTGGPVLHYY
ncbi:hypothetical protein [Mangrovitalea sediminis]|uniref:hypothetical protein n=1 Tax=Mangrovitalea sediminis TaxID=1982043 RepID=UPI000BE577CA|nr:hypothetical protein [Mangrovitalea sediminis]